MAVTKVESLTRQLEDVRRDRRAPLLLMADSANANANNCNPIMDRSNGKSASTVELDKLRCELMVSFYSVNVCKVFYYMFGLFPCFFTCSTAISCPSSRTPG